MMSEWNVELRKTFFPVSKRYQNWQRHFTGKRISSKMTFPNNDNRWKRIVQKSWQDTTTQFCVCKDSKNIYFVKALDYQFLWICLLLFFFSVGIVIQKKNIGKCSRRHLYHVFLFTFSCYVFAHSVLSIIV